MAVDQVSPGDQRDQQERGQDEKHSGGDATDASVHQPAQIGCELLRLGSRQQHAVVERVEKSFLRDPPGPFDHVLVHQRDLSGWSAETDKA
jgi:hypothetical protein